MTVDAPGAPSVAKGTPCDVAIVRIGLAHNRVLTRSQLLAAGVSRRAIDHRLACGRLYGRHPGVYLLDPPEAASRLSLLTAALASYGDSAYLSHRSAAEVWGLIGEEPPAAPIDITVVGGHPRRRDGVRLHRISSLAPSDRATRDGLRVTGVARTVHDLACQTGANEVEQAAAVALRRRLVSHEQLRAVFERYPSRRGARTVRAVLSRAPVMTRSQGERRMLTLLRQAQLDPPLVNARVLGFEVDFLWPAEKLVVEFDGFDFHSDRQAFETDRRRDAKLAANGYRVLRFTGRQLRDEPMVVVARIAQALGGASPHS